MKGKTIIELTDVRDGSVEKIEDDNMVTNAIGMVLKGIDGYNVVSGIGDEYYKTILGGLLLFDGRIAENASTIYAPSGVEMVGCGAYGFANTTEDTALGVFNATESGVGEDGKSFKFVYDFGTSQANGRIACACLTSADGAVAGYGQNAKIVTSNAKSPWYVTPGQSFAASTHLHKLSRIRSDESENPLIDPYILSMYGYTAGKSEVLFAFDSVQDVAYYLRIESQTNVTVVKRRADMRYPSMISGKSEHRIIDEKNASLSTALPTSGSYIAMNFDTIGKKLYLFHGTDSRSTVANGASFTVTVLDLNGTAKQYSVNNTTGVTCAINNYNTPNARAIGCNGYVYLTDTSTGDIYKIKLDNTTEVTKLTWQGGTPYNAIKIVAGNRIHLLNKNGIIDPNGNTVKDVGATSISSYMTYISSSYNGKYSVFIPDIGGIIGIVDYWGYDSSYSVRTYAYFAYPQNYLASINNLPSIVTKSADKTMKVTYIINEE